MQNFMYNDSFLESYFFKLIFAFAVLFTAVYATNAVTIPSENAPKAVVVAAATTPVNNENTFFPPFLFSNHIGANTKQYKSRCNAA